MWLRLIAIPLVMLLFGCASHAQKKFYSGSTPSDVYFLIDREDVLDMLNPLPLRTKTAPLLNFTYSPPVQAVVTNGIKIALAEPHYIAVPQAIDESEQEISPADTMPQFYRTQQAPVIISSLQTDLGKILIAKGFIVSKASGTFNDLSAAKNQAADLIATARFDFGPLVTNNQTILRYPTGTVLVLNKGVVELTGSLTIEVIEPVSKQKIMIKKIDVTTLSSNVAVEYENPIEAEHTFVELLNKVYPRLMEKLENNITADDIKAAIITIKHLKEKGQSAPAEKKPL